jgi:hypothetical protein
LKSALEGKDIEAIKQKKEALEEKVQQLSVKLYEQMSKQQQANQADATSQGKANDDVVDADYEEMDDDKN